MVIGSHFIVCQVKSDALREISGITKYGYTG